MANGTGTISSDKCPTCHGSSEASSAQGQRVQLYGSRKTNHGGDFAPRQCIPLPLTISGSCNLFQFCRFGDFTKLTDREFTDGGDHIKVVFLTRKNYQMGDNSEHIIPARGDCTVCPTEVIRLYFQRFGLSFNGSGLMVNFQLRKEAGTYMRASGQLSRGNATKYT
jgi:hypothetical protein